MDITRHLAHLSQPEIREAPLDIFSTDPIFTELIHIVYLCETLMVHGSYFYQDYLEDEFYSFEGKEELLSGLLQLCMTENQTCMEALVEKLDRAFQLYELTYGIARL